MSQVSTSFPKIKHKNSVSSQHYTILCQWNPVSWDSDSCLLQNTFTDKSLSSRLRFVWCCYATPSLSKFWSPVQPFPQQIYNLWNPLQFCLVLPRRKILEIRTTKQNCRFPRVLFQPSIEAFIDRYCLTTAITFTVHPINIPHETLQIEKLTWVLSSWKPSRKLSSSSSALSILSAYSPTIQIMAALASGSSRESKFSHRVAMMLSYLVCHSTGGLLGWTGLVLLHFCPHHSAENPALN